MFTIEPSTHPTDSEVSGLTAARRQTSEAAFVDVPLLRFRRRPYRPSQGMRQPPRRSVGGAEPGAGSLRRADISTASGETLGLTRPTVREIGCRAPKRPCFRSLARSASHCSRRDMSGYFASCASVVHSGSPALRLAIGEPVQLDVAGKRAGVAESARPSIQDRAAKALYCRLQRRPRGQVAHGLAADRRNHRC